MSKIQRTHQLEDGTFLNTINYNASVATPLGKQIVNDYYTFHSEEELADEDVADFDPKNWVIRSYDKEVTDENTGEVVTYTNKVLVSYKG